ncbi:hypothetical protein D3C73_1583280 [compost metagenome]
MYELSEKYKNTTQDKESFNDEIVLLKKIHNELTEILVNVYKGDIMRKFENGELGLAECFYKMYPKKLKDNPFFTFED